MAQPPDDVLVVLARLHATLLSVREQLAAHHGDEVAQIAALLHGRRDAIDAFVRDDDHGRIVLPYLERLGTLIERQHLTACAELEQVARALEAVSVALTTPLRASA